MSDEDLHNSDEFENEDDREEFKKFYERYKQSKDIISHVNEYYTWLNNELDTKGYAIIPEKYTGRKNLPVCIFRVPSISNLLCAHILN